MSSTPNIPSPKAGSSKVVAKKILAGRKCYRVSKTSNEVVWPPVLEEALIEGLEKYEPAVSKSPRGLSRFPNRNKFIAQYILQKTGQIRTRSKWAAYPTAQRHGRRQTYRLLFHLGFALLPSIRTFGGKAVD
ncbi:hypothetical protein NUW54_g14337 [Trametes sanguinea]|uniref:Uncharacterized protein n=1 Tax=Trametes sanguinea TaxID=158606 RepID=A0ACC1MES2_9APHY|nr:hypothetical protein NUW54_g14337 [Trametes sanguinea]